MTDSDNTDSQALSGAMYFIVGRGTEGGSASYRLSVAGVTDAHWGEASHVKANSGYSTVPFKLISANGAPGRSAQSTDRDLRTNLRTSTL